MIIKELANKTLEQQEQNQILSVEVEGLKEKIFEVNQNFSADREALRKTMKQSQEMNLKITDIINKNNDMMSFQRVFNDFRENTEDSVKDLFSKYQCILSDFTERLNKLDDLEQKADRRLLTLERESVVLSQDLASHKLLKRRQYDHLEEKTWQLRDFKDEL